MKNRTFSNHAPQDASQKRHGYIWLRYYHPKSLEMKKILYLSILMLAMFISMEVVISQNEVSHLVTKYYSNPIGIDVEKPRLSWQLKADRNNVTLFAYELRFGNSISDLTKGKNLTWTTGKVESAQSVNVAYQGPSLKFFTLHEIALRV